MTGHTRRRMLRLIVPSVMLMLLSGGCHNANNGQEVTIASMLSKIIPSPREKHQQLQEKLLSPDADIRREGVNMLTKGDMAKLKNTGQILSLLAQGDPDGQVRVAALTALARTGGDAYLELVLQSAVKDSDIFVRRECVKILRDRGDEESMDMLLDLLNEDNMSEVRVDAAVALADFRDRRAVRGLINALADNDFGVTYRARQSLQQLTGRNFGEDQHLWLQWLANENQAVIQNEHVEDQEKSFWSRLFKKN